MSELDEVIEMRIRHVKNDFDHSVEVNLAHAEKARTELIALRAELEERRKNLIVNIDRMIVLERENTELRGHHDKHHATEVAQAEETARGNESFVKLQAENVKLRELLKKAVEVLEDRAFGAVAPLLEDITEALKEGESWKK